MRTFALIALLSISGCLSGCKVTLSDTGEVGFRYGTEFTFFHRTSRTDSKSVAELGSQPLDAWLSSGAPQQTDGEPVTEANDPQGVPVTPTGSMAVPIPPQ